MPILISGANGKIGKDLVKSLSKNFKIFAVSRSKKKIKKIKNVYLINHDFKKSFSKILKPKPKYIIHCAVDQKNLNKDNKRYIFSNNLIIENLIDFAKKNKVKLIVNLSSIDVYGKIKKNLVNEKYSSHLPNLYGRMKLITEKKLYNQKINFINLRLPGVLCNNRKNSASPWFNKIVQDFKKNKDVNVHNIKKKFNNVTSSREIARLFKFLVKKTFKSEILLILHQANLCI